MRGHGLTPGRPDECSIERYGGDVAALITSSGFSHAILVGHSMGCRVVLEANRLMPERVAGIVLVDGSRLASGDPKAAEDGARAVIAKAGYAAFAEDVFRQMFFKASAEADAIVARALGASARFGPELWPRMARWDAAVLDSALAAVRAPLLAIQTTTRDAQGQRVPLQAGQMSPWLELLTQRLADVKIEVLPGLGHFPQLEAPERVNRLVADFAAR